MTEHHPTYWEARNVYQRLADLLPLVDKLCFVAEHGEVVSLRKIVNDALGEMFRLQQNVGSERATPGRASEISLRDRALNVLEDNEDTWIEGDDSRVVAKKFLDALDTIIPGLRGMFDGTHVAVPKEPTEDMIAAGWIDKEDVSPADIYVAMIEAAQEQR